MEKLLQTLYYKDLSTKLWSRKESEFFGWSQIHKDTRHWSRSFCPTPTPELQLYHFLHHTPKSGFTVEMVRFLLKLMLKQNIPAVHHGFH